MALCNPFSSNPHTTTGEKHLSNIIEAAEGAIK